MSESNNIENVETIANNLSPDNSRPSLTLVPSSDIVLETIIDNEIFSVKISEDSHPINDDYADDVIIHTCQSSMITHIRGFMQYIHSYNKTAVQDMQSIENNVVNNVANNVENNINIPPVPVISISQKCVQYISTQFNNQDTNQKLTVVATICMELYRILMGSLLLSFVPQKCGDHICGITENLYVDGAYYIVYIINIMTFISFLFLYMVEIKRENRLITYLDVSNTKPTDAISVAENLRKLPDDKRENILYIDKIYQQIGCFAIAVYVFNTIVSGIVIYDSYLDNKTTTAFLTNILFMGSKVSDVYSIANTENNIFFSAYLKHKVQYNDVDPDKISDIEFGTIPELDPNA